MDKDDFTGTVIGYAMKVHGALGPGFVEYVYRNALIYELRKAGMKVEVEKIAKVYYEGINVGEFRLDLFINGWLVCELKAVRTLIEEHEIATVNYLSAIRQDFGLLLNFGAKSLQFKRKFRRGLSDSSPADFRA